ncbi:MAG TPA: adenylosuccinate synthetase [Candidatus Paceibacterota bacterium]|nr:adenylosuccinate synthetase [Candidatus Pacearchaeota archaeon]HRZ50368.1 adenylosuccinate synthetase [Candidatus Paceibacterota bacterium]HSA36089.1 adenylosuccinate synthetase [Candidatus Paceibacterota bacterium]
MPPKVYLITDLGIGDGGKGTVVHKVATMTEASWVFKAGGFQGSHGMQTVINGRKIGFAFSQFGCATLEGIRTFITPLMVASPEGWLNEAAALANFGIYRPLDLLWVDAGAICGTPYHGISSRLKELARGNNPRGTIGTGAGETYRYSLSHPDLVIRAGDLISKGLAQKLKAVRDQIRQDLEPVMAKDFLAADDKRVKTEISLLNDDGFLEHIASRFLEAGRKTNIVDGQYLEEIMGNLESAIVFECSHGVLGDPFIGFHPHTNAAPTLPSHKHALLRKAGYAGPIIDIGVTRAYAIRHGAGPLPTADPNLAKVLLPGSHKPADRYQGEVRVGPLDMVLLRYAIAACGGPEAFNGLAVTWFDQIQANGQWQICRGYDNADDGTYFLPGGEIIVSGKTGNEKLQHQEELGKKLMKVKPVIETLNLPANANRDELFAFCARGFEREMNVPVRMVSFGPSEQDKICK